MAHWQLALETAVKIATIVGAAIAAHEWYKTTFKSLEIAPDRDPNPEPRVETGEIICPITTRPINDPASTVHGGEFEMSAIL